LHRHFAASERQSAARAALTRDRPQLTNRKVASMQSLERLTPDRPRRADDRDDSPATGTFGHWWGPTR
jgi:phage shock protein A